MSSSVLPGGTASFHVVYAPTALGAHTAALSLSNDSTNTPYVINLAGAAIKRDQDALIFTPASPQAYLTTNALSVSGGSGTGDVSYAIVSGPGTIVGGTGLAITSGSGSVLVQATKAGDDFHNPQSVTGAVAAAKADQTISFPAVGNQLATNKVGLAATASSELGVTFSVLSGPAALAVGTNLSFTGVGTVRLLGDQAGDETGVRREHLVRVDHREAVAEQHDDRCVDAGQLTTEDDVVGQVGGGGERAVGSGGVVPVTAEQVERVGDVGIDR